MIQNVVEYLAKSTTGDNGMTPVGDYVTIAEAEADPRVPYSEYWIRSLCRAGTVEAIKVGGHERRGQWLVNLPSLLEYIEKMDDLGTKKHNP